MSLALFDLDKTLIDGDSEEFWIEFLIGQGEMPESARDEVVRFGEDYVAGRMDFDAWQAFMLAPQARLNPSRLSELRDAYTRKYLLPIIRPWMQARVAQHVENGDRVVVITATNRWLVEPIVAALGIADLIATDPELEDGRFTGAVDGPCCFQQGKLLKLDAWRDDNGESGTAVAASYSDSWNDLPLLELAAHPVAVTPDDRLRGHAESQGWEIIDGG